MAEDKKTKVKKTSKSGSKMDLAVKITAGVLAGIMVLAFGGTLVMCLVNI